MMLEQLNYKDVRGDVDTLRPGDSELSNQSFSLATHYLNTS